MSNRFSTAFRIRLNKKGPTTTTKASNLNYNDYYYSGCKYRTRK